VEISLGPFIFPPQHNDRPQEVKGHERDRQETRERVPIDARHFPRSFARYPPHEKRTGGIKDQSHKEQHGMERRQTMGFPLQENPQGVKHEG